jgi:hypothetical protein
VVKQKYEVQVYDEYVISGNTAVLRCQVPSYVAEYVMVTSWIQDGSVNIYPNTDTGKCRLSKCWKKFINESVMGTCLTVCMFHL